MSVYAMIFVEIALLLRTFPFFPPAAEAYAQALRIVRLYLLTCRLPRCVLRCQFVAGVHSFDPNHAPALLYSLPCRAPLSCRCTWHSEVCLFRAFFAMMLSSGRTVRWVLSGAGYLYRTAGYLYTRLG